MKRCQNDKPWVNDTFRELVQQKKRLFHVYGEESPSYKRIKNKVNRTAKTLQARYNEAEVVKLCTHENGQWWRSIKQLAGIQAKESSMYVCMFIKNSLQS